MSNIKDKTEPQASSLSPKSTGDPFDFVGILVWIWNKKWTFVVVTSVFIIFSIINALMATVVYTARVTMLPEGSNSTSDLLGQVQSFTGISLSSETSYEQLYGEIIFSDKILDRAISRQWNFGDIQNEISLLEIFLGDMGDPETVEALSITKLKNVLRRQVIKFFRDDRTGYMFLEVAVPRDPEFAADLGNYLARELDRFIREIRSQKAEETCNFISTRLEEVSTDLRSVSDEMTTFLSKNRNYQSSPALLQKYLEIEREVQAQTSVWIELRKQLELAKIDLNKELKSVNILDIASIPTQKSAPNRTFRVVIGSILGIIFSFFLILAIELFTQTRMRLATLNRGIS